MSGEPPLALKPALRFDRGLFRRVPLKASGARGRVAQGGVRAWRLASLKFRALVWDFGLTGLLEGSWVVLSRVPLGVPLKGSIGIL